MRSGICEERAGLARMPALPHKWSRYLVRLLTNTALFWLIQLGGTILLVDGASFLGLLGSGSSVPIDWQGPRWTWVVYATITAWFSTFWAFYAGAGLVISALCILLRAVQAPGLAVIACASLLSGCTGFFIVAIAAALSLSAPMFNVAWAAGLLGIVVGATVIARPQPAGPPP